MPRSAPRLGLILYLIQRLSRRPAMRSIGIVAEKQLIVLRRFLVHLQMTLSLSQPPDRVGVLLVQRKAPMKTVACGSLPVLLVQVETAGIQVFLDHLHAALVLRRDLPGFLVRVILYRQPASHPARLELNPSSFAVRDPGDPESVHRIAVRIISCDRVPAELAESVFPSAAAAYAWPEFEPRPDPAPDSAPEPCSTGIIGAFESSPENGLSLSGFALPGAASDLGAASGFGAAFESPPGLEGCCAAGFSGAFCGSPGKGLSC